MHIGLLAEHTFVLSTRRSGFQTTLDKNTSVQISLQYVITGAGCGLQIRLYMGTVVYSYDHSINIFRSDVIISSAGMVLEWFVHLCCIVWARLKSHITVTSQWPRWLLKSPVSPLFTQSFVQTQIKKNSKLRVTGLFAGNSPVAGKFPAQRTSNAENVSIWWRHHEVETSRDHVNVQSLWLNHICVSTRAELNYSYWLHSHATKIYAISSLNGYSRMYKYQKNVLGYTNTQTSD